MPAATLDQPAADGVRTAPAAQSMGEQARERRVEGMTDGPGCKEKGGSSKIEFKVFAGSKIHKKITKTR